MMRVHCKLFGCETGTQPCCERCANDLYDCDFVQQGLLSPAIWFCRSIFYRARRVIVGRNCGECGKRFRRGYNEHVCSSRCFDNWLPF